MQLPCTHYTTETALINHWRNVEAFKISVAGTGMFSTPHTKGISGQTFQQVIFPCISTELKKLTDKKPVSSCISQADWFY